MEYKVRTLRRALLMVVASCVALIVPLVAAPAASAGPGRVDGGVPFSSVVYGTGCSYTLRVQVDQSGIVDFYQKPRGADDGQSQLIGHGEAYQGTAAVRWIPRSISDLTVYAVQHGERSEDVTMRVRQGYGSGWACFAL